MKALRIRNQLDLHAIKNGSPETKPISRIAERRPRNLKPMFECSPGERFLTSLIKLRTREQIYFLKNCIDKDLTTPRIWKITEKLGLQRKQGQILRKTMMKNLRRELYQKLSKLTREQTEREGTLREMIREEDLTILRRQERAEQN